MIFAMSSDTDVLDRADERDAQLPRSVANPRRTTWTGFAKDDADRLPGS
jgi:hypothetical protein